MEGHKWNRHRVHYKKVCQYDKGVCQYDKGATDRPCSLQFCKELHKLRYWWGNWRYRGIMGIHLVQISLWDFRLPKGEVQCLILQVIELQCVWVSHVISPLLPYSHVHYSAWGNMGKQVRIVSQWHLWMWRHTHRPDIHCTLARRRNRPNWDMTKGTADFSPSLSRERREKVWLTMLHLNL